MIIVFFIISIIVLTLLLFLCSSLKIQIKEFELINRKINKFELIISLALFNKLRWLKLKLDNDRISKMNERMKKNMFNKLLNSKILTQYKNINSNLIKEWKHIFQKMDLEKINLNLKLGTEDASVTACLIGIISAFIGILLPQRASTSQYLIEPIYKDKNYIYLSINCIIAIKMVHIINIRKIIKEKEVYQEYGKSSNRRSYANNHG